MRCTAVLLPSESPIFSTTHSLCLHRTFVYKHCVCAHACVHQHCFETHPPTHFIISPVNESELSVQSDGSQFSGPILDRPLKGNMERPTFSVSCPTLRSIRSLKIHPRELHLLATFWWIFFARYFQTSKVISTILGRMSYLLKKIIRPQSGILQEHTLNVHLEYWLQNRLVRLQTD